jgi:hypothetical protein
MPSKNNIQWLEWPEQANTIYEPQDDYDSVDAPVVQRRVTAMLTEK